MPQKLAILSTHPIQYYSPWYRALAERPELDLTVYYAHRQTPEGQAAAGYGVAFEWDVPLLDGYHHEFLTNISKNPAVTGFWGCDTPEIADRIVRNGYDAFLVHGWYNKSYWQAMRSCWRTKTPLLVRGDSQTRTERSLLRRLVKSATHRWFVPRFDGYLVVGKLARDYLLTYGASADRMYFTPHFVDNSFFERGADAARPRRDALRKQWGLPDDKTVFLFVGRFVPGKRCGDFVAALGQSAARGAKVAGLLVGDGPDRPALEALARDCGAPTRFAGFLNQRQVVEAYAAADVLVLPSVVDTWGLVVNEAMAAGLPAIVNERVGCGPDLVAPGKTGFVHADGDVSAIAGFMEALEGDRHCLDAMSVAARRKVAEYSIAAAVNGTLQAVANVGRSGRAAANALA